MNLTFLRRIAACIALTLSSATLQSQVATCPGYLDGTARWTNADPAALNLLTNASVAPFFVLTVSADSMAPSPPSSASSSGFRPFDAMTYSMPVEGGTNGVGIAYSVGAWVQYNYYGTYEFAPRPSSPVLCNGPTQRVDFAECAGLVDFRFVNAAGLPVVATSMAAYFTPLDGANHLQALFYRIPLNATNVVGLCRAGGVPMKVEVTASLGTNDNSDRIYFRAVTTNLIACDRITVIPVVLPTPGGLGRITGNLDIVGEFEASTPSTPDGLSLISAGNGPFGNQRLATLPGVNLTVPSSGAYSLSNMLPSGYSADQPYDVKAYVGLRTGNRFATFSTAPMLTTVPTGGVVHLGDAFVIKPGYFSNAVQLKTPPGNTLLQGLKRAADYDADLNGVPDFAYLGALYPSAYWEGSFGYLYGTTTGAPGATNSANAANAVVALDGAFDAGAGLFRGGYEAVLGHIGSQPSYWRPRTLTLTLQRNAGTLPAAFAHETLSIFDDRTNEFLVLPGQTEHHPEGANYNLSEICLSFRSLGQPFTNVGFTATSTLFNGMNYLGLADRYLAIARVTGNGNGPATTGLAVGLLPESTYTITPTVLFSNGTTLLPAFTYTVTRDQVVCLQPELQVSVTNSVACYNTRTPTLAGQIRSTGGATRLLYRRNGGPEIPLCSDCPADWNAPITLAGLEECAPVTIAVIARNLAGNESIVTFVTRVDLTPPIITCPADVLASSPTGAAISVSYPEPTATDNCAGPLSMVCTPPSGSAFPVGTTLVQCTATDACGNRAACSFQVRVQAGCLLSIARAVKLTWPCGGVLQGALNPGGPWTDIPGATSPFYDDGTLPWHFYRARLP